MRGVVGLGNPARDLQAGGRDLRRTLPLPSSTPTSGRPPCRLCQSGQRLSTLTFAIFAAGLAAASLDPAQGAGRQAVLALCAGLSALAVFRFAIARLVGALSGSPRA